MKPLQDLMTKDMNRKEFLAHVGGTMLAVIGIAGLIKKIADPYGKTTQNGQVATGYGSSAYGGGEASSSAAQAKK